MMSEQTTDLPSAQSTGLFSEQLKDLLFAQTADLVSEQKADLFSEQIKDVLRICYLHRQQLFCLLGRQFCCLSS